MSNELQDHEIGLAFIFVAIVIAGLAWLFFSWVGGLPTTTVLLLLIYSYMKKD